MHVPADRAEIVTLVTAGFTTLTEATAQMAGVSEVNVLAIPDGGAVGLELVTLTANDWLYVGVGAVPNASDWSALLMTKLAGVAVGAGL